MPQFFLLGPLSKVHNCPQMVSRGGNTVQTLDSSWDLDTQTLTRTLSTLTIKQAVISMTMNSRALALPVTSSDTLSLVGGWCFAFHLVPSQTSVTSWDELIMSTLKVFHFFFFQLSLMLPLGWQLLTTARRCDKILLSMAHYGLGLTSARPRARRHRSSHDPYYS